MDWNWDTVTISIFGITFTPGQLCALLGGLILAGSAVVALVSGVIAVTKRRK